LKVSDHGQNNNCRLWKFIYLLCCLSALQGTSCRPRSPRKLRQTILTDMRSKAAEAAASLTAAQPDSDSTSELAARLLASMEAATQRRKEALEMRKARSAAKQELLLQRLVGSMLGSQTHHLHWLGSIRWFF
jgi:hypothetical protein